MRHMVLPVLSRLRATLQLGSVPCASFTTRGGCPAGCRHRWHRAGRARREILGGLLPKTGEYPPEVFLGNKPPELTPTGASGLRSASIFERSRMSLIKAKTMGMVLVARLAARAVGVPPPVTMTSTWSA